MQNAIETMTAANDNVETNGLEAYKPGSIWVCSWGYEQTNVDFYQVVACSPKGTVKLQEIGKKVSEAHQTGDMVVPDPEYKGEVLVKRANKKYPSLKLTSYSWAHPWDGRPHWETGLSYGH